MQEVGFHHLKKDCSYMRSWSVYSQETEEVCGWDKHGSYTSSTSISVKGMKPHLDLGPVVQN